MSVAVAARSRAARGAAERRRKRTASLRHRSLSRIFATLAPVTLVFVVFIGLHANVLRLNYDYARLAHARTRLVDETTRLDDRIASLESRERLADVAARLGMLEPRRFAVATVEEPRRAEVAGPAPRGIAFLPAIASWLR